MKVEFDKSFEKWLSKINDTSLLHRIEQVILQLESAQTLHQVPNVKKLSGFSTYYRIKLGRYRLGFELKSKSTINIIIIADRKDIYTRFPK